VLSLFYGEERLYQLAKFITGQATSEYRQKYSPGEECRCCGFGQAWLLEKGVNTELDFQWQLNGNNVYGNSATIFLDLKNGKKPMSGSITIIK
jgi:hypothetical protein